LLNGFMTVAWSIWGFPKQSLLGKEVVSRRDWIELSLYVMLNGDFHIEGS